MRRILVGAWCAFGLLLAGSLYLAHSAHEGLVENDCFRRGERYLAEKDAERAAGVAVEVTGAFREGGGRVTVAVATSQGPLDNAEVTLEARRIDRPAMDRLLRLRGEGDGTYAGRLDLPAPGLWIMDLSVRGDGILARRRFTAEAAPAPPRPAAAGR